MHGLLKRLGDDGIYTLNDKNFTLNFRLFCEPQYIEVVELHFVS